MLAYRHQKHVQYEMTQDALESKREQLEDLEKSEREAKRLEEALGRGKQNGAASLASPTSDIEGEETREPVSPSAPYLPPHPGPNPTRRRVKAPGMGLLNALSYTLHGMMDVDPETVRRNGITKTRENISQVCLYCTGLLAVLNSIVWFCSSRMPFTCPHKISNILVPQSKQI